MVATLIAFPARPSPRPHAGPAPSCRYERRRPEKTPLYKIVSECLEGWLADRSAREQPVAGSIEEEFRGYLTCGLLCFGFARALCTQCPQRFVIAFSCKRRGVCPSCNGRHMAQTAAHLIDHVIPPVPVRQWVISLPKRLRGVLGDRPKAVAAVTRIFLAEIEKLLCSNHATLPSPRPRLGAVSFLHRFGSGLNRHAHLHAAVTDGVFLPGPHGPDAPPAFLPARPLTQGDLAALTERVRRRVIAFFKRQGFLNAHAAADMLAWENSGFSIDASVRITLNRPRRAELLSVARASPEVLCPAPLRTRTALRDPRRRQPHRSHPLRDAPAQGRQLGRARPITKVNAAGSQRRHRAHAV
jgi:hypothetical protein